MKKILLGTTAMVGASVLMAGTAIASDPPTLTISGYMKFEAWFADQDATASSNRAYHFEVDDAEVHFNAKATADNGLKYGVKIEVDVDNNMTTDEAVINLEGGWGILFLGDEDSAADLMKVAGFSVLTAGGGWDGGPTAILQNPGSVNLLGPTLGWNTGTADGVGNDSDATKISYFSPSFSGFRLGVSLVPDSGHTLGNAISDTASSGQIENLWAFGGEYKGTIANDFNIHVSARGLWGSPEGDGTSLREDVGSFGLGGKVEYQGWGLAVGYADNGDSNLLKTQTAAGQDAGWWADVGLSYSNGPYKIAGGYFHSEEDRGTTGDDEVDFFSIGGNYNVAPGLDIYAEYDYVEIDDSTGSTTAVDNDASLFLVGTKVTF